MLRAARQSLAGDRRSVTSHAAEVKGGYGAAMRLLVPDVSLVVELRSPETTCTRCVRRDESTCGSGRVLSL